MIQLWIYTFCFQFLIIDTISFFNFIFMSTYLYNLKRLCAEKLATCISTPHSLQVYLKNFLYLGITAFNKLEMESNIKSIPNSNQDGNAVSGDDKGNSKVKWKRNSRANFEVTKSIYENGRFKNPWSTWRPLSISSIIKFALSRDKSNIPKKEVLEKLLPVLKPKFEKEPPDSGIRIVWLGHSTLLVQFDGVTFLTDPIFSERASLTQYFGPKRYREIPCSINDLPSSLDAVLISHNHFDHLDLNSVTLLNAKFGKDLCWFVPMGLGKWFDEVGCKNVCQLDWWEESCLPDKINVSFICTPCQHWSKRSLNDDNTSLWCSWTIIGHKNRFFFAGDTGYCSGFKEIGKMYGPFDVAALPIGAYEPRWFMKYPHVNPIEAVEIHKDIRSRYSVAVHWGTFAMANENIMEPPEKLKEALVSNNIPLTSFETFKHGESRVIVN